VLASLYRSLKPGGKLLLRMGGQGDAAGDGQNHRVTGLVTVNFQGFEFPYTFPAPDAYRVLLQAAGFAIRRLELVQKDMAHDGQAGWIRTTWLPYAQRLPENRRETFIEAVAGEYLQQVPLDADGKARVAMVLLEVEADKSGSDK
jgi:trans-aconitate methyltransferase